MGPVCNLNCEYCFLPRKQALFRSRRTIRMSDKVYQRSITNYIASSPPRIVEFSGGGEPTLLGVDFFKWRRTAKAFMNKRTISNALRQTDDADGRMVPVPEKAQFQWSVSASRPKDVHDRYRRDRTGKGTFDKVMQGLKLLQNIRSTITYWRALPVKQRDIR